MERFTRRVTTALSRPGGGREKEIAHNAPNKHAPCLGTLSHFVLEWHRIAASWWVGVGGGGRLNISAVSVKTGLSQLNPGYALPSLPLSSPPFSDAAVSRFPFLFEQSCPPSPFQARAFSLSYSLKQLPSLLPREGARGRIKIAFPASRFLPAPPLFFTSLCSIHQMKRARLRIEASPPPSSRRGCLFARRA